MVEKFPDITIALPIADRARSLRFYTRVLDLQAFGPIADDGIPEPLQFRLGENTVLMLIPRDGFQMVLGDRQLADPQTSGALHVMGCQDVTEVRVRCDKALVEGGKILKEPDSAPWGYSAICADPDGHAWEFSVI